MIRRIPSSITAATGLLAVATIVVAGCGQAFSLTGGTGGAEGSGGDGAVTAATTSGSGATASATSTGGGTVDCNWSVAGGNPCAATEYCEDPSCGKTPGAGKCKPKGMVTSGDNPVCGCDGLTYWNESIATSRGIPTQRNEICPKEVEKPCTSSSECSPGAGVYCQKVDPGCDGNPQGACWVLPSACNTTGKKVKGCLTQTCVYACTLIKFGGTYDSICN